MRAVPTLTTQGDANGAPFADPPARAANFAARHAHRLIGGGIANKTAATPYAAPSALPANEWDEWKCVRDVA